jgi:hypothetical protein
MTVLADTTATVTAWATVAAVVVALGGSFGTVLWRWWRRPRLKITFGNQPPLLTLEPSETNPQWQYVRAKVENKGKRGAGHVRAQITGSWVHGSTVPRADGRQWPELTYIPIPLKWASRSFDGSESPELVDLAPKAVDYLDISRKSLVPNMDTYDHLLCGMGNEALRQSLRDRMMTVGEYRIEIAVFSDDAKSVAKVVSYKQIIAALQLTELTKSKRPPNDAKPTPPGDLAELFKGPQPT